MIEIDLINNLIKIFFLEYFTYLVYAKIINCKNKNLYGEIIIILVCIFLAVAYVVFSQYLKAIYVIIISNLIYAVIISKILNKEINYSIIVIMISFVITYILYLISVIIVAIVLRLLFANLNYKNLFSLFAVLFLTIGLINLIFKIKRVNKGFNFLKDAKISKTIVSYSLIFSGIIIVLFELLQNKNGMNLNALLLISSILIFISLIIWIKSQITKTYKNRMRDRTIEIQKTEIDEQTKIMEEIRAENIKLATAVHKYNKKFSSLEFAMKKALELESKTEFANEISTILEEYQEASKNFAKEVEVNKTKLPETNIAGIDNMFKYMQEEASKQNINFDLKLNTNINPLIETVISKDKFETLIGDHLKDAIIAVNASTNSYKSILVTLGLVEGIYELSIYDTGIEFEINTLLKLGKEQVTTHKDEGGSGIGFMTTFETLKECKASLVIEEYNPEATNYTKAVIIRFDGKNEYKICSYRAEKIKEQKHERRIIIEKLK